MSDYWQDISNFGGKNYIAGNDFYSIRFEDDVHFTNIAVEEVPKGLQCHNCGHAPMSSAQMVWAEETRRIGNRVEHVSQLARRVAPPRRPTPPPKPNPADRNSNMIPSIVGLCIGAICLMSISIVLPFMLLVSAGMIYYAVKQYRRWKKAGEDELHFGSRMQQYQRDMEENEREFAIWQRLWLCRACGRRVIAKKS